MSYSHYEVSNNAVSAIFMETLRNLQEAWDAFTHLRGSLLAQKDADNDYTSIASNYGYSTNAAGTSAQNAAASFAQIDSAWGNGNSAIVQMLNQHL